jgi:hypothetical protein
MTEQPPSTIGTVAQEAARLIEDMATMAQSSYGGRDEPRSYGGGSPQEPFLPDAPPEEETFDASGFEAADDPSTGACSACGAEPGGAPEDQRGSACRLCPLCRGIDLLRSVRPETVDLLADLALSVAASLRDVASRSRASERTPSATSASRADPREADRASVQDIPVDDDIQVAGEIKVTDHIQVDGEGEG